MGFLERCGASFHFLSLVTNFFLLLDYGSENYWHVITCSCLHVYNHVGVALTSCDVSDSEWIEMTSCYVLEDHW